MEILAIDDEVGIHESLLVRIKQSKEFSDWTLRSALTLDEGLRLAREYNPDVILLDLHFKAPVESQSIDASIASIPALNEIGAVVILTGFATPERWLETARLGALHFLDKTDVLMTCEVCPKCKASMPFDFTSKLLFNTCINAAIQWKVRHDK